MVGKFGTELIMVRGVDRGVVVERVGSSDEQSVAFVGPAGVVGAAVGDRRDLLRVEAGPLGEVPDVHAPFVLAPAPGARPIDQDLAITKRHTRDRG